MKQQTRLHVIMIIVLALLLGNSLLKDFGVPEKLSGSVVVAETPQTTQRIELHKVHQVVDGDTLGVEINGVVEKIRLIGVDTPETKKPNTPVQCFGKEATNYTTSLVLGKNVQVVADPSQAKVDKYGRMLAYIFTEDGMFLNKKLIEDGYAYEYTYNVPYQYQKEFKAAQQQASSLLKGLWSPETCKGTR